ncbi:MAG: excinuclease ABC subunit UvrA, partial [Desulfobacterales bacterium]
MPEPVRQSNPLPPDPLGDGMFSDSEVLSVKGAREHNLKHVDLVMPKRKLIVITGVSGSGKSSLAIDTIFAEGQRRYVESLSAYARQFIGQMEKPKYDTIRGLSPTICIEQKTAGSNPRSTVGTITEIYDHLRVLYARIGAQHCHRCGEKVGQGDPQSMVDQILALPADSRILILAPLVAHRKGEHREVLHNLRCEGFARVRIDGVVQSLENVQALAKHKKHTLEVVIDRLQLRPQDPAGRRRVAEAVESALKWGRGQLIAQVLEGPAFPMNSARTCCGAAYPELSPQLFSFNAPQGMCPECNGIGSRLTMDEGKIIPDPRLTIREGALVPWRNYFFKPEGNQRSWGFRQLSAMAEQWGIDFDTPWKKLPPKQRQLILYGSNGRELIVNWQSAKIQGQVKTAYEGLIPTLLRRFQQTQSEGQKKYYSRFMATQPCPVCQGRRLKPASLAVRVGDRAISELATLSVGALHRWLGELVLSGNQRQIAA